MAHKLITLPSLDSKVDTWAVLVNWMMYEFPSLDADKRIPVAQEAHLKVTRLRETGWDGKVDVTVDAQSLAVAVHMSIEDNEGW